VIEKSRAAAGRSNVNQEQGKVGAQDGANATSEVRWGGRRWLAGDEVARKGWKGGSGENCVSFMTVINSYVVDKGCSGTPWARQCGGADAGQGAQAR